MAELDSTAGGAGWTGVARPGGLLGRSWLAWGCLVIVVGGFVLDPARPAGPLSICLFKRLTRLPCPGCGTTRAVVHCGHGQLARSFRQHPLGPAVWLAAAVGASSLLWPRPWRESARRFWHRRQGILGRLTVALAGLLAVWALMRMVFHLVGAPRWWPWVGA